MMLERGMLVVLGDERYSASWFEVVISEELLCYFDSCTGESDRVLNCLVGGDKIFSGDGELLEVL